MVDDGTGQAAEREAVLTLSALVGAISIARAVDDPDLSEQIMASAAVALKQCILNRDGSQTREDHPQQTADVSGPVDREAGPR